ncbi:MAG: hemolysin family protein [Candidatus Latescibacteria bacterium]|nr:hemolysin family protein [Candidatus Latescibacterota bacterium]
MDTVTPILIIIGLIALNGFFVAAEFAIVGVPQAAIERLAARGHRVAGQVRRIIRDPRLLDRYIATAQLGITAASLGLGMYGEHFLAGRLAQALAPLGEIRWITAHALASVLAISILTYFHIVLGEMVPKSLALISAERAALWITPPMRWLQYAVYPLVVGLNGLGNGILGLMGIRRELSASQYHTSDEIEYLVRESEAGGLLRAETGRVVRDLFEFGELTASEVMVPRVHVRGLPLDATNAEILTHVRRSGHTRYPVYDGDLDHIVGMVHLKDLFGLLRTGQTLREAGVRSLPYLPESAPLDAVLASMREGSAQIAVVMDEHGGTAGIITLKDLFDEVVGDIEDESAASPDLVWGDSGALLVRGTVRLEEVGEAFELTVMHEDVDTVSGLILAELERPPLVADVVVYYGLRYEVTAIDGHGVGTCRVTREPAAEPGD